MITSIRFRNFRGIQQGVVSRFRQFNLLIGPNNAGKSTLLEALYLAATAGREAVLTHQERTYDVGVSDKDMLGYHPLSRVWTKHGLPERWKGLGRWDGGLLRITVEDRESALRSFTLSTEGGFPKGEEQVVALFSLRSTVRNLEQEAEVLAEKLGGREILPFSGKSLCFCWHPELSYHRQGSATWVIQGDIPVPRRVLFYEMDIIQRHLLLDFYQRMLGEIPGWSHRIAHHFGKVFDIGEPFSVQFLPPAGLDSRWEQGWIAPEKRRAMPIDMYGDGARAAFKLLTPLIALAELTKDGEPGLVLWEEPELFQHPRTLDRLLQEVAEIVHGKPVQLFISSQSLEVVACFTEMARRGQINGSQIIAFRLALEEGTLRSSWFDADNLIAWLEAGRDPRAWGDELTSPLFFSLREEE